MPASNPAGSFAFRVGRLLAQDGFKNALYRPFDTRVLFYTKYMVDWPRPEVMSQMLQRNIGLCVGRAGSAADGDSWNVVFCTSTLVDMNLFRRGGNVIFPLFINESVDGRELDFGQRLNLKRSLFERLAGALGVDLSGDFGLPAGLTAENVLHYIYALLHSPTYRSRYKEFLKIDYPRIPLVEDFGLAVALAGFGHKLVRLHLMEPPVLAEHITTFIGSGEPQVEKVSYSDETVWINKAKTRGFKRVPDEVWNFHIGGYKVCEKWLKDRQAKGGKNPRPGRVLTDEDIDDYQKIVVALSETIRIMNEIDEVIEAHGGWPGAFQAGESTYAAGIDELPIAAESTPQYGQE